MAEDDPYEGDFTPPDVTDESGLYFLEGALSDPVDPPEDPIPLANVLAEEFYELEVE